jgi:cytochrome c peroxidase
MHRFRSKLVIAAGVYCAALAFSVSSPSAQNGSVLSTPVGPMELPIEVEIELSPAGSLKQAATWPELYRMLKNPYAIDCPADDPLTAENESYYCTAAAALRRPSFGATPMPALQIFSPGYNFLTAQPLRRRTSDGEVSWDQPGPLFDPAEDVNPDLFNTPTVLRTPIGHIVACPNDPPYQAATVPPGFCAGKDGSLVVLNTSDSDLIPPDGTVIATAAYLNGALLDDEGAAIGELEAPVNEEDFFRDPADTVANNPIPASLRPYIGRSAAEVLGKALFWDMQVGSDGIQSCGTCHFHAGADSRTRGQLNPNINGPLGTAALLSVKPANTDVVASDFPFHKGDQDSLTNDSDDVMSSMGVSRFKLFNDIPPIGSANFLPAVNGVRAVAPDIGTLTADLVPENQGLRRVEPRNTPTMISAAFNFDNFWDGRARFSYNGGSVFGPSDPAAHIFINPGLATAGNGAFAGATMGDMRPDLKVEDPEVAEQPVRIKFSSLASQSQGPPLSDFEMSFAGRNWAKIGKKLLQGDEGDIQDQGNGAPQQAGTNRANAVVPLANQLVAIDDSRLGPFSNQGGSVCTALGRPVAPLKPGLCISYPDLIRLAFGRQFWNRTNRGLQGVSALCQTVANGQLVPPNCDPFDSFRLQIINANTTTPGFRVNRNMFTQMEGNFSFFFGLSVQAYETLLIPDQTPVDNFFDANPFAGGGVGEPGDQAVLFPTLIRDIIGDGQLDGNDAADVTLVTGFGPDELFGFDLFAGANLTAAIAPGTPPGSSGRDRNPQITNSIGQTIRVGSNPFTRSAKCMLCHLGPEQTDHSINISHGLLKNDAEFEYPVPPVVPDPTLPGTFVPEQDGPFAGQFVLPAPEPSGASRTVVGLILEEEVGEGVAQDAVEVEPRDFQVFDDPATPWDDRIVAQESNFAFGDQGVYNIGLRPFGDDIGRGGSDPFGWPLSLAALTLKNIGGQTFEPCDTDTDSCVMAGFDPSNIGATFETTGADQTINPGFERGPINPQMPDYMAPWIHDLPAGELHPQIDEMAGMVPNTITAPNGGPGIEFPEIMFGADFHCALYDPREASVGGFGYGPPNWGWGPPDAPGTNLCPQIQSGVAGNFAFPSQGTWPVPNRVMRDGAFKAPPLRNVELTGPFFHTGSFLTLRQVVDFYFDGGDFPVTNRHSRDPHVVDLEMQAFAFGTSQGGNLLTLFDCSGGLDDPAIPDVSCGIQFNYLVGSFGDGLPDTAFLYDQYPDSDHPITPEPVFASREEALEDAKNSIVKFLLALTDPRVKFERAPFDKPEIFVPIDGRAPENVAGRADLIAQSGAACAAPLLGGPAVSGGPNVVLPDGGSAGLECFRQIPATGATGLLAPLPAFLRVTNIPPGGAGFNCSASGPVSHFCSTITP